MSLLGAVLERLRPLAPEAAVAWAVRGHVNRRCRAFGQMTRLQIDSANQRATLELELKGESGVLQVTIGRYELSTTDGKTWLEIKEFQISREWLNVAAGQFLRGRKFEVPELLKALL